MKVFIQQRTTGLFWSKQKSWTQQQEEALEFKRALAALDFCEENQLRDVELMILFPGSDTAVRVAALAKKISNDQRAVSVIGAGIALANSSQWFQGLRWLDAGGMKMAAVYWLTGILSNSC